MSTIQVRNIPDTYTVTLHEHGGWAYYIRRKLRCTVCGHRLTVNGVGPVATRKLAPWKWPLELLDRRAAMRLA